MNTRILLQTRRKIKKYLFLPLTKVFYPYCRQLVSRFQFFWKKYLKNCEKPQETCQNPFLSHIFVYRSKAAPYTSSRVGISIVGSTYSLHIHGSHS